MNIDYSNINSVEELKESYKEYFPITEDKEDPEPIAGPEVLPVVYSDLKAKPTCLFKNIIVFTNDRSEDNKTLENIREAIEKFPEKPNLYVFVAAKVDSDDMGIEMTIEDDETTLTLKEESNVDTVVFSRLGVQGEYDAEKVVKILQDRGFLVLNPVRYSELACDKYETAVLLEKAGIPQPRYTRMTKSVLQDDELYVEALREVYPEFSADGPDKNESLDIVVKILDGHGGTGVFMIDCKRLKAILQTIFAIDSKRTLILQRKEEADGGDIRVHVLTMRNKQVILGAMKRVKLGGDFRSNVSLGATAEPIKLTKEQEQIALRTAKVSHLPWCAVDIMPLKKGSNKEIGDNVVLEINASPGTDGITDVLGVNFVNVILNELNDPSEFLLQDKTAGYSETVNVEFTDDFNMNFLARLDTGNSASAATIEVGQMKEKNGWISFDLQGHKLKYKKIREARIRAGEELYTRPVVIIPGLSLGPRKIKNIPMALVPSRDKKSTNVLLNRDALSILGYIVSPTMTHILTEESEKVKIIG